MWLCRYKLSKITWECGGVLSKSSGKGRRHAKSYVIVNLWKFHLAIKWQQHWSVDVFILVPH